MAAAQGTEQVARTSPEDARKAFDDGSALFVDVRGTEDYERGHIPGALSIPVSGRVAPYLSLPHDRDVILY